MVSLGVKVTPCVAVPALGAVLGVVKAKLPPTEAVSGLPECAVHLAQCVIYLAQSKKSVAAYLAYGRAQKDVEKFGNLPVPLHIRNAPTKLMKDLDYGKGYKYTPLEDSSDQEYLPDELKGMKYL